MEKYGISGYPSLLFVNANGNLKAITTGFQS
jgi:protein-disulfide isomerase-like protein with CxxC motif